MRLVYPSPPVREGTLTGIRVKAENLGPGKWLNGWKYNRYMPWRTHLVKNYCYIRLLYRINGHDCIPTRTITVIEICKAVRF